MKTNKQAAVGHAGEEAVEQIWRAEASGENLQRKTNKALKLGTYSRSFSLIFSYKKTINYRPAKTPKIGLRKVNHVTSNGSVLIGILIVCFYIGAILFFFFPAEKSLPHLLNFHLIPLVSVGLTVKKIQMEARGKYDFSAALENELSFKKGDILKVSACDADRICLCAY